MSQIEHSALICGTRDTILISEICGKLPVLLNSINLINFAHYFNKMNITLLPITSAENKSSQLYISEDCQNILGMWDEYYPQIGFNPPWSGYFVLNNEKVVGSCAIIKTDNTAE